MERIFFTGRGRPVKDVGPMMPCAKMEFSKKGGDITHWVIWNIPGTATKLSENVPTGATLMDGSHQANNIAGSAKYFGPSPPAGAPYHHYILIVARSGYVGKVKGS
jgi:phosphatidylethanolamine-binding protein (PEBP) family uncharacterized protein